LNSHPDERNLHGVFRFLANTFDCWNIKYGTWPSRDRFLTDFRLY